MPSFAAISRPIIRPPDPNSRLIVIISCFSTVSRGVFSFLVILAVSCLSEYIRNKTAMAATVNSANGTENHNPALSKKAEGQKQM